MEQTVFADPQYLQLVVQLKRDFRNLKIHHDIGLIAYDYARQLSKNGDHAAAYAAWQCVIAHWTPLFNDDSYWEKWASDRAKIYESPISDEETARVKTNLRQHLRHNLQLCDDALSETALSETDLNYVPLIVQMDVELKGIRVFKQVQPLTVSDIAGDVVGGWLMLEQFQYLPLLNERIRATLEKQDQSYDMDNILGDLLGGDDYVQIMTDKQIELLMDSFSAIGYVRIALDQQNIPLAKRLFSQISRQPQDALYQNLPLDNGFSPYIRYYDSLETQLILADSFHKLAQPEATSEEIARQFEQLLTEAEASGRDAELHQQIVKQIDEHTEAADEQRQVFLAEIVTPLLKRFPDQPYGRNLALKLMRSALTIAREGKLDESAGLLERAYSISPRVHSVYHNMGLVRRAQATNAFKQEDYFLSLRLLRNAREVYTSVLSYDPDAKDAPEQIKEIDSEIEVVMGKLDSPLEGYLGTALTPEYEPVGDKMLEVVMASQTPEAGLATVKALFGDQPDTLIYHLAEIVVYRATKQENGALQAWQAIASKFPAHTYHAHFMSGLLLSTVMKERDMSLRYYALALKAAPSDAEKLTVQLRLVEALFFLKDYVRLQVVANAAATLDSNENRARKLMRVKTLADQLIQTGELSTREEIELAAILAEVVNPTVAEPPVVDTLKDIAKMLDGKLRYTLYDDYIWVAFQSDTNETLGVSVSVDDHLVVITCKPHGITRENYNLKLYNYLYMSFDMDFIHVQWQGDDYVLASKFWKTELTEASLLDIVIRFLAVIAELEENIDVKQIGDLQKRYMTSLGFNMALGRLADQDRKPEAVRERVNMWARQYGLAIEARSETRDQIFIRANDQVVSVHCIYKMHGVSFVASYDLNMQRENMNPQLMLEITKMNAATGMLRLAIDKDGDVGVLYETLGVSEEIFLDMTRRYEEWLNGNLERVYEIYNG